VSNTLIPATAQQFCAQCGEQIPSGTRRPRLFCDRPGCRKAASRARHKPATSVEVVEFCDTEQAWLRGYRTPDLKPRRAAPGSSKAHAPVILLGSDFFRGRTRWLDLDLVQKILAAEIGIPTTTVVSADGIVATVVATVAPKPSTSSAASRPAAATGGRHPAR
jgi:hypothetical protein